VRSGVEIAYSRMNHRIAGAFLLVLAGLATWAAAGRGVLPRALAAPVWLVFGVYLFLTADPEAWPVGGGTLREALADPLVVQHKLLSLIPVAVGGIELLSVLGRAAGLAPLAFPALAVAGGIGLFLHDHDGGFHLDRAFIQHAAMGTAGVAGGAVLFLMRRRVVALGRASRLRWAWPVLLLTTALVLVLYSE
jgi:putative copper resistance protein D